MKSLNYFTFILALLGSTLTGRMTAQTFKVLHTFTNSPDGNAANGGLLVSGSVIYGTTALGGAFGSGTVFRINSDGTGLTNLYSFTALTGANTDGALPVGPLALSGNALYGTAEFGGTRGSGTVFRINTDGTGFTNLYYFTATASNTNSDGARPDTSLIILGNTLYGTASMGGSSGKGTIFAVNTDGSGFTNLYNFGQISSDGSLPSSSMVISSNILYGTAAQGGSHSSGIIFSINTNGTGYTILYNFLSSSMFPTSLILSGDTLYGSAENGQITGQDGTVFSFNLTNSVFTSLHNFSGPDGDQPYSLILAGNTLYGTTVTGYNTNTGIIFSINTDGTGLQTLFSFPTTSGATSTNSDGAFPVTPLVYSGNTLYGMACEGGLYGVGTVYSLSLPIVPPQLTITSAGTNVLLSWPTNAIGFALEFATNLPPTIWNTDSTAPVIVDQQNVVTNSISGTQMFFRLSQPLP